MVHLSLSVNNSDGSGCEIRSAYKVLVGNLKRIEHSEHLDVDGNIRIDLRETGCEDEDWMHLTQDIDQWWAVMNTAMNLQVP